MTEPRDPQPLSAEELADVRSHHVGAGAYRYGGWAHLVARLLVTLDAARSIDGLREALRDLPRYVAPDGEETYVEWDAIRQLIEEETALATSPPHVCPPCEHMDGHRNSEP